MIRKRFMKKQVDKTDYKQALEIARARIDELLDEQDTTRDLVREIVNENAEYRREIVKERAKLRNIKSIIENSPKGTTMTTKYNKIKDIVKE